MLARKLRYSFGKGLPKNIIHLTLFTLRFEKSEKSAKVAVVVSKKIDSRATARNRVKRVMVAHLSKFISDMNPYSLVFFMKKEILNADSKTIDEKLEEAFSKIK